MLDQSNSLVSDLRLAITVLDQLAVLPKLPLQVEGISVAAIEHILEQSWQLSGQSRLCK